MNRSLVGIGVLAAALSVAVVSVAMVEPSTGTAPPSASLSHGTLRVTIPYDAPHSGDGQLTVEVLDPEDGVAGRGEVRAAAVSGKGEWAERIPLSKPIAIDELVWYRLRYRFTYADGRESGIEGIESISEILQRPVLHIIGQTSYLAGAAAAVRVIVTDTHNAPAPGTLKIDLGGRTLFAGALNARGTVEAQFRLPAGVAGAQTLRYTAETPIGSTEFSQQVRVEDKSSILLTTEKPIYQPGQMIHVRALALDRANHQANANRALTFEVEDSRGNKVFKKVAQTDRFGIASAEFALADEVNLGTYHLRALMDANQAEIAMNVERYVLPKFKVAIEFSGAGKHGYRPGDRVTGIVRANYFFGKPVGGAEITVKSYGRDVAAFDTPPVSGKTDADGAYRFEIELPKYFAGNPLSHGAARALIEAAVKDSAGHTETRGEAVVVSESPLLVTAVPEGGTLIPNLENQVYVLTSYADGKAAVATVKVRGQVVKTDASGVAVIRVKAGAGTENLEMEASDQEGNRVTVTAPLQVKSGTDQILLRADRAVYRAGDRIQLTVYSTRRSGTAYIDVVKEGQTVLTRDVEFVNGKAELTVPATAELAGTLDCNAYLFGHDARPVGDHRLLFVQPADELKIEATSDAAVYRPGDDARVRFRVTNAHGEGVQAALGVHVVDEAVFALAEKQPGFAKVFFYLEQEALKPRYEIHSIGMPDVVEPAVAQRDLAARALFAATEMAHPNRFETEYGREVPREKFASYYDRYRKAFVEQAKRQMTGGEQRADAWGEKLRVQLAAWRGADRYDVQSAGPDKRFGTEDDLSVTLQLRTRHPGTGSGKSSMNVQIEHDRGPFNGHAEIVGLVTDGGGVPIEDATVSVTTSGGQSRTTKSGSDGHFRLAALPAGDYEIEVASSGVRVTRRVEFEVRDRALVSALLGLTAVQTADEVVNAVFQAGRGVRMMAVGGVIGGVVGGVPGGLPMPAAMALTRNGAILDKAESRNSVTIPKEAAAAPRVRSYFPEALYINPEIVTDGNGIASITIPMADSITTWRMALMASTARGALGSGTSSLKVFQDFFVDLDLPVTLTQGDRVSIPVAVYNYSGTNGDVDLQLQAADWFAPVQDAMQKNVAVESGRAGGAQFTIEAKRIGKFKLTLAAHMRDGSKRVDIVVREIEVIPNGREQSMVFNGRLENTAEHALNFPADAIPDASKVLVRLYPGPLSQVIEGMDSILRMPSGCFEQTSSATYPNVLALDYMKRTKKLTPEVHAKAEGFIGSGYQRLLTFEVPGGGFSWFGSAPANKILTAYGLMEFSDMSKVHDVDPKVIQRTQQWLASQQQADGSWKPDTSFINEGATNRYNTDLLRIAAYLGWALESSGFGGPAVEKARQFIDGHMGAKADAYTLAVLANFAVDYGKDREFTRRAMQLLLDARTDKDDKTWWTADETGVYGTGESASVETTGLAVQALLKWGQESTVAGKALNYIASKKDATGVWRTTQATIVALRALLLSTEKGAADVRGVVDIAVDGKSVRKLTLTADNNDLLHQFVFPGDARNVALRFSGKGGLAYQVTGRYFLPWTDKTVAEPLSMDVKYDRTRLAQDDIATATATVKNNLPKSAKMVMIDLGIPPGFELLSEDLQTLQEKKGHLQKFSLTATQAILYLDALAPAETYTVKFRLRAKYPIRARTFQSRVYEYYNPDVSCVAKPVQLEVGRR